MKIYIAGPDVFFFDAKKRIAQAALIARAFDHEPLTPIDNEDLVSAVSIYAENIKRIEQCDVVIANVDNFRGMEPDSGTCFEIGYAVAKGKKVITYYQAPPGKTLIERLAKQEGFSEDLRDHTIDDTNIEDFGYPLNLMLAMSTTIVEGTFEDAIKTL